MTTDECYVLLSNQFDQYAGGAPKNGDQISTAFLEYLKLLYSPEQANLLQHLKPTMLNRVPFGQIPSGYVYGDQTKRYPWWVKSVEL